MSDSKPRNSRRPPELESEDDRRSDEADSEDDSLSRRAWLPPPSAPRSGPYYQDYSHYHSSLASTVSGESPTKSVDRPNNVAALRVQGDVAVTTGARPTTPPPVKGPPGQTPHVNKGTNKRYDITPPDDGKRKVSRTDVLSGSKLDIAAEDDKHAQVEDNKHDEGLQQRLDPQYFNFQYKPSSS